MSLINKSWRLVIHSLLSRRDWNLFSKLFTALIFVSIMPVIACSILIYFISRQNVEAEVSLSNLETLKQTQVAIDNTLEATERISLQIVRNKEIQNFMNNRIDKSRSGDSTITNTINVADSFSEGVQYIESINIYSFLNNVMVSSGTQRYAEMDVNFIENYGNSLKNKGFTIWIEPDETGIFGETSRSVQFVEFIFETFNRPQGIVLIKLKNDEFAKSINDMYIRKSGHIFVINDKGNIILGKNKKPDAFDPADFMAKYKGTTEGYYKIDVGKQQLLVSFTTSRYNGWKYVAVLPSNEIADRASLMGKVIAIVCLIFVAIAIFLSFRTSKGISSPISAIDLLLRGFKPEQNKLAMLKSRKDELGRIQQELDNKLSKLKNYFLYRLTYGGITDNGEIQNQARFLDIPVEQVYVVLIIDSDKTERIPFALEEGEAVRRDSLDIIQKACSGSVNLINAFYEYRDDTDRIVAVVAFTGDQSQSAIWTDIKHAVQLAQQQMHQKYHSTITVAVGNSQKGLENIQASYKEANDVLKYKFIKGANAIILRSELDQVISTDSHKYFSKHQLVNCLDARNLTQVAKILENFKASMKEKVSLKAAYVFYCKEIINILVEYLDGLGCRFNAEKGELKEMFDNFEKKFDDIDYVVYSIMNSVQKIIKKMEEDNPEVARRGLIEKAIRIIELEFDKDIGLSYVCSKIGISEPYFSKIFKDEVGKNFKEYLTSVRIAAAKDLLMKTEDAISLIAGHVGYNNHNQFAKMFKKYEGVTPGEYRILVKNKTS